MQTAEAQYSGESWLEAFLTDEKFCPTEPRTLEQTGLTLATLESLIAKHLAITGTASGRAIAESISLPFRILEEVFAMLRTRQMIVHCGAAPFNDFYYMLTEQGQQRARPIRTPARTRGRRRCPFEST